MSLARLLGLTRATRGAAVQAAELPDRPEPALAAGRRGNQRGRLRRGLVRRRPRSRASSAAPNRRGATATCASWPRTSPRGSCFAHIRASIGSPVQQTNCHPFRHGRWLWMHNGIPRRLPRDEARPRRWLSTPSCSPTIEGSTDSELFFYLALTFGLAEDPPAAVARAVGCIEETGGAHGVDLPGADDGGDHRRRAPLGVPVLQRRPVALSVPQHRRVDAAPPVPGQPGAAWGLRRRPLVVSEPLGDLRGAWREVPESTCVTITGGTDRLQPFQPA